MTRVLLIEDDLDTGEAIRAMLELQGHQVHWAHHGREALAALREEPPFGVVLSDILMPEMDGVESIQHIHRSHPELAVVAMTAQRNSPYLQAAILFGAQVTLHKPFTLRELDEALTRAMASSPPAPGSAPPSSPAG